MKTETLRSRAIPAAILAGGLATRLRPLTENIPKSMIEIAGKPFIAHQLKLLAGAGVEQVVLCLGYQGELVRDFVQDGSAFGLAVQYSFDGPHPRGTAGALVEALPLLGPSFFVLYGDSYLPCDYAGAQKHFEDSGRLGLMTVYKNGNQFDRSNVEYAMGHILVYDKTSQSPTMRHIDYGLGVFRREAFDRVSKQGSADLATLYQDLLARGELAAFEAGERFYEIGSFAGIDELNTLLARS